MIMVNPLPTSPRNNPVRATLAVLLALFAVVKIITLVLYPGPKVWASDLTIDNILQAVNQQRAQRNLTVLNTDSRLSSAAQSKADDMQARHYFAHVDPDGNYIWPKIVAAGYSPYLQLGENLAIEFYDTNSLINAWMNSPTHRANILNDGFVDQGMGLNFGDTTQNQYHSVVANTFGALLIKKTQAAPTPAPQPTQMTPPGLMMPQNTTPTKPPAKPKTSSATPAPNTVTPPTTVAPPPVQPIAATPASSSAQNILGQNANPLNPRGDYAMAEHVAPSSATTAPTQATPAPSVSQTQTTTPAGVSQNLNSAPAVVSPQTSNSLQNYQINRYLTLAFGIVLFLFLITDLREAIEKKSLLLSKKAGNLTLLFMALVVIVVMYWL